MTSRALDHESVRHPRRLKPLRPLRRFWRCLPPELTNRRLLTALGVSSLLHVLLLSLDFGFPDASKAFAYDTLEIVLVNTKSKRRPKISQAQALAQHNLDGGGSTSKDRLAKTPLPNQFRNETGDEIEKRKRRAHSIKHQHKLLARDKQSRQRQPAQQKRAKRASSDVSPGLSDRDSLRAMAELEAVIALQTRRYNKLPKKKFLSPRTLAYPAAFYLTRWAHKVERIGHRNYPVMARGRLYGAVVIYVELLQDGSVVSCTVEKGSGYPVLDEAALMIVRKAAPYGRVPETVLEGGDILAFSRTINFTRQNVARVEQARDLFR